VAINNYIWRFSSLHRPQLETRKGKGRQGEKGGKKEGGIGELYLASNELPSAV